MSTLYYESSISHHGIRGMKWGVRRYQNPDGSLTRAGRRHYMMSNGDLTFEGHDAVKTRVDEGLSGKSSVIKPEHLKKLDAAYSDYSKFVEPINRLMNDPKLSKKYGTLAYKKFSESDNEPDISSLRDFVGSDLDYGPDSTVALYYKDKGVSYKDLHSGYMKVFNALGKASDNAAKDVIESFGQEAVSKITNHSNNTLNEISIKVNDRYTKKAFKRYSYNV